jgi:uncharacterized protein DUF6518
MHHVITRRRLAIALAALVFGGTDQYLGSLTNHGWGTWAIAVSLMSAPWLLLPFVAGMCTPRQPGALRGAGIGLLATYLALLGYFVMTNSPVEGASLAHFDLTLFIAGQAHLLLGGLLTGPLFGYLGYRWRVDRTWWCALAVALAAIGEPLARLATNQLDPSSVVWTIEVVVGVAMICYVFAATRRTSTA